MDLGGSWAPFGRGLGRSGPSVGHFWMPFGRFFGALNRGFFKHGSKMGSKRPFGSILGRFWRVLGGVWEGLEGDLGRFTPLFSGFSFVRTPALPRSAPRSVTMRGGLAPPAC